MEVFFQPEAVLTPNYGRLFAVKTNTLDGDLATA